MIILYIVMVALIWTSGFLIGFAVGVRKEALEIVENLIRRDPACFNLSEELQSVRTALRDEAELARQDIQRLNEQDKTISAWENAHLIDASAEARLRATTSDGFIVETKPCGRITKIIGKVDKAKTLK